MPKHVKLFCNAIIVVAAAALVLVNPPKGVPAELDNLVKQGHIAPGGVLAALDRLYQWEHFLVLRVCVTLASFAMFAMALWLAFVSMVASHVRQSRAVTH